MSCATTTGELEKRRTAREAEAHAAPPVPGPASAQSVGGPALVLILTAAFMVVLDFSIVNVALPSVQRELGFSTSAVQWIVTAYAITFGGLLIFGGRAADLFGRRRMFVTGLLVFTAASLSGGLAHDQVLLIASRAVQGIGGALVAPSALSLITTGFPAGQRRNRALGMYGATASIGFVAGQVLGGVLVEFTSWRAVFLVNVPVGVAAVLVAPRLLGRSSPQGGRRRMDVGGASLITLSVAALVYAVSQIDVLGWADPRVLGALLAGVAAAVALYALERRHPDPLIRTDLLRQPGLRKAAPMNLLLGLWNGGELIVLSLYFQQVLHESPLVTGLVIAPQGVIGFTAGVFGARLARGIGVNRVLVLTSSLAAVGFLILSRLPAAGLQSAVRRRHARRLRHGGYGLRHDGHREPGRCGRRAGPDRRRAQHRPPGRCGDRRGPAAGDLPSGGPRWPGRRRDRRPRRDADRRRGRRARGGGGLAGRTADRLARHPVPGVARGRPAADAVAWIT